MSRKRIDIFTIYRPQDCIKTQGSYIVITKVNNKSAQRLSTTKGNINLTDYWLHQGEIMADHDLSYTCQHIPFLSDEDNLKQGEKDDQEGWWKQIENKYVCVQFIKALIVSDKDGCRVEPGIARVTEKIEQLFQEEEKICRAYFRTIDNADVILVFADENKETVSIYEKRIYEKLNEYFFSFYSMQGVCEKKNDRLFIRDLNIMPDGDCNRTDMYHGWCYATFFGLKNRLLEFEQQRDKKMSAYYRVLLQTVNVLAQYEQATLLKDLFFIFYPPIALFMEQLQNAEKKIEDITKKILDSPNEQAILVQKKYQCIQTLETAISQFIDAVEELMYHTGHSCRDILCDTGKGGMPFDIPIRLCLMYVSYLGVLTSVLNDTEHRFEYCLYPVTYSRPVTRCIEFMSDDSSLIRVKVSKHMMYSPRSFLIILSHEVSHYVNKECRNRVLRAELFVGMVTITLVNMLTQDLLQEIQNKNADFVRQYIKQVRINLYNYISDELKHDLVNRVKTTEKDSEKILHFRTLWEMEKEKCGELLYDCSGKFDNIIQMLGENILELTIGEHQYERLMEVHLLQKRIIERKNMLLYQQKHMAFLEKMQNTLKEIYADISAILILNLDPDEYLEAYLISESYIPKEDEFENNVINRFAVVNKVVGDACKPWKDKWNNDLDRLKEMADQSDRAAFLLKLKTAVNNYLNKIYPEKDTTSMKESEEWNEGDLFYCKQIVDMEVSYLKKCYGELDLFLERKNLDDRRLTALRNLYQCFKVYDKGDDISFKEYFLRCDDLMALYKHTVSEKRKLDLALGMEKSYNNQ